jgi:hypothetical protein
MSDVETIEQVRAFLERNAPTGSWNWTSKIAGIRSAPHHDSRTLDGQWACRLRAAPPRSEELRIA